MGHPEILTNDQATGTTERVAVPSTHFRVTQPMHILILAEWYPSKSEPVAGVFVRDQARAASSLHEVTILTHDPRRRQDSRAASTTEIEDGLRVVRVHTRCRPGTIAGRVEFMLVAKALLRGSRLRGKAPDIIHAHVFSAGFLALMLARGRVPVVVSEHHSDFVEGKVRGHDARVARFVFRHAALVCPVSSRLRQHIQELEPSGRYAVVPNVVDVEAFMTKAERNFTRIGPKQLLVVALLSPEKGIEYLISALAEVLRTCHADVTLDVVGDGPSRSALERLAADQLPTDTVRFHGVRSRSEVVAFMERSDVLVLPSVVETFGVVLIEALAAGLPVITTTAIPNHERIAGRFGLVVAPRDAGALRDAILAVLDHGWTVPHDAAVEVLDSFSPPVVGQRWNEIYGRLARA